ncbi:MAG: hypothetical protein JXR48_10925 [Candidatus Delongbacteria bacterium]|nr:hypothetical protein [Candidatus Delongbacteria bacterium]MBN2835465.1 hypothetical protein [Candidatus Delongbacteria bacterium]
MKLFTFLLLSIAFFAFSIETIQKEGYVKIINPSKCEVNNRTVVVEKITNLPLDLNLGDITFSELQICMGICVDEENNITILDGGKLSVYKISSDRRILNQFGKMGNGPGEFSSANVLVIGNNKHTYIPVYSENKVVEFDENCKFVKDLHHNELLPSRLKKFGKGFIGSGYGIDTTDDGITQTSNITYLDENFNVVKEFFRLEDKSDLSKPVDVSGSDIYYTVDEINNKVYVGLVSDTKYIIEVYDENLTKIQEIERGYRKVSYSKEETEELKKNPHHHLSVNGNPLRIEYKSKKSIEGIYIDKKGFLWVDPAEDKSRNEKEYFDVYDNGKLVAQIEKAEINDGIEFLNVNGKLFFYDETNGLTVNDFYLR